MIVVCLHLTPGHVGVVSAHNVYVRLVSTLATYLSTGHGMGTIVESVATMCDLNNDYLSLSYLCVQVQVGHWVCCHQWQLVYLQLQPLHPQIPPILSVPQPYPVMGASLHPSSLTFAASVAP